MAKHFKPRKGSRAYWPKKRAARIYPNIKTYPESEKVIPLSFAAYKAGMSRAIVFDSTKNRPTSGHEIVRPVTIMDCPPLSVCGIKLYRSTAYGLKDAGIVWADGLAKDLYRKTNTPKKTGSKLAMEKAEKALDSLSDVRLLVHTRPRESGIGKKRPELFEIPIGGKDVRERWEYAKSRLGSELRVSDVFADGEMVDAVGVSKGKGYQGPVKRFGVKVRSRKNKKKMRHVGSLGPQNPARVIPAKLAMPGQLGFQTRTEYNKNIIKIGDKPADVNPLGGLPNYGVVRAGYIVIEGSVPGPKKRLVMLRKAMRPPREKGQLELRKVLLDPQQ